MTGNLRIRRPFCAAFFALLSLLFFQKQAAAQCSPTDLEIPGNGIDEDCDNLDDFYLQLPPYAYAVAGQDFEIYFRNLILSKHPNDYSFEVVTPLIGVNSGPKWAWTPTAAEVGTHDLTVRIKTPGGTVLGTASTKIRVSPSAAPADMTAKKCVLWGHSFYDQGYMPVYINNLTNQAGNPPITYHGKKASWATPFTKHEGYGGFMWRWFIQDAGSPFRYGSKVNLRQYFDDVCGGPGKRPDFMVIHFDINDFCGYTALAGNTLQEIDDSITNDWNLNAKRLLDSIRVAAPNCKLGICISPPPNARESAFQSTYGGNPVLNNRWRWQKIISRIIYKNIERYSNREGENFWLIPEFLDVDDFAEYNPPDARHLDPPDNNINTHCGYNEIAKTIYAWIKYVENLGGPGGQTWYQDADGDNYGNPAVSQTAPTKPAGYVSNSGDCNDANAAINPAAAEICGNGIDDNCNGQVDESIAPTGYCASTSGAPWEDWIASVKIGAVEKTSGKTPYSDFTSTTFPLAAANTIALSSGFSYTTFDEYWRVWIDLNRDGDFSDAGEMVAEKLALKPAIGTTTSPTTASFSMSSSICGSTRMRVAMTRSAFPAACGSLLYGEVEDFTVTYAGGGGPTPKPDLIVSSITAPASATAGNPVSISFLIKNNGTATDGKSVQSTAWLSSDNSLSANDLPLGSVFAIAPAVGLTANAGLTFTIPSGQAAGSYFLIISTDDANAVAELDETNNTASQSITVAAAPPQLPDLVIASATIPASLTAGAAGQVSFSVKNNGTGSGAGQSVATAVFLSTDNVLSVNDLSLGSTSLNLPTAGASISGNIIFTVQSSQAAGSYFLILKTDNNSIVTEADEMNNQFSQATTVVGAPPQLPDLVIASATIPASLTAGAAGQVSFSMKNNGVGSGTGQSVSTVAYLSTDNVLSVNDLSLGSASLNLPTAGASAPGSINFTVSASQAAGSYFIILKTDDSSTVAEADEANNLFSQAVTVASGQPSFPDLIVASLTAPATVAAGGSAQVSFSVKNTGTATGGAASVVTGVYLSTDNSLSANDLSLGFASVAMPAAGGTNGTSLNFTIPAGQAVGSYFLIANADDGSLIGESEEANNTFSQPLSVTSNVPSQPDLVIASATVPASLNIGSLATISFSLKNIGTATATGSVSTTAYLSSDNSLSANDLSLGSASLSVPNAGASTTGSISVKVPTGTPTGSYFVVLNADDAGAVIEASEANNQFTQAVNITANPTQPDLSVTAAVIPSTLTAGASSTVSFFVKNTGAAATSPFQTALWLSLDNTIGTGDVFLGSYSIVSLATGATAGGSLSFALAANQIPAAYFLILNTDAGGTVAESNEANNQNLNQVTVSAPAPVSYCTSSGDFPWEDWISRVKINAKENPSDKSQYTNFTGLTPFIVTKNGTNSVRLYTSYSFTLYEEYWRIWMDFNKDGDFLDAGELVFSQKMSAPPAGTLTTSLSSGFALPSSTPLGTTRMRVAMKRGATPPTSCEVLPFGEVEDYTVTVQTNQNNSGSAAREEESASSEGLNFRLSPNPTTGGTTVELPDFSGKKVGLKVFDALGRMVLARPTSLMETSSLDLDLSEQPAGIYQVLIEVEGLRAEVRRLVLVEE